MRELLADETMQEALLSLVDSNRPKLVADTSEAIVSVRQQSFASGYDQAIQDLLSLREPIPAPPVQEETSYEPDKHE